MRLMVIVAALLALGWVYARTHGHLIDPPAIGRTFGGWR